MRGLPLVSSQEFLGKVLNAFMTYRCPLIMDVTYWRTGGAGDIVLLRNQERFLRAAVELWRPNATVSIYLGSRPEQRLLRDGWEVIRLAECADLPFLFDGEDSNGSVEGERLGYVPDYRHVDPVAVGVVPEDCTMHKE